MGATRRKELMVLYVTRVIDVSVPVRICDIGGWTDTWFGGPGRVLNIGVGPGITVALRAGPPREAPRLVEAALELLPPPAELDIVITSAIPAGSGTGTSAAVAVALLAGLSAARGETRSPHEVASLAHRLEVHVLGNESGIQDQLSAAYGGINFLEIDDYPDASVRPLAPWDELGARLSLVYLGHPHDSSGIHREVIDHVARQPSSAFDRLRDAACAALEAVVAQDLDAFGRAMIANTEAQRALHPSLVGADAEEVIEGATRHGAIGWKVNGAGGDGGSITILHETPEAKIEFEQETSFDALSIRIEPGLRVHGSL
jgi:D-glycero-alpha-D-manno-heptose-7-phosphate kinase